MHQKKNEFQLWHSIKLTYLAGLTPLLAVVLGGWLDCWLAGRQAGLLAGWLADWHLLRGRSFHGGGLLATEEFSCLTLYL